MTEFKTGDRVRLSAGADYYRRNGYNGKFGVGDKHGTVVGASGYGRVDVVWDGGELDHWNYPPVSEVELVEPEYDQDTVSAIVKHLREHGWHQGAQVVDNAFAQPKTRTVAVNFQVPEGKSVVDYLENVGIDYDIEGGN